MDTQGLTKAGIELADSAITGLMIALITKGNDNALTQVERIWLSMMAPALDSPETPAQVKAAIRERIHGQMEVARLVADRAGS